MTLYDDPPAEPAPPPPSEEDIKAGVLDYLGDEYAPVLDWLRVRLVRIYRFRLADVGFEAAFVTADDARRLLPRYPGEKPACNNFLGSLFKAKGWAFTGSRHKSETPGSHSNEIRCWRYVGNLLDGGPYGRDVAEMAPKEKP